MKKNLDPKSDFTLGEKVADRIASVVGSWGFVIFQSLFIIFWIIFNLTVRQPWDPYPFILLNLALSFQAAYSMPIIMMSQNRVEERDRNRAEADYQINIIAEKKIEEVIHSLRKTDKKLETMLASEQRIQAIEERLIQIYQLLDRSTDQNIENKTQH